MSILITNIKSLLQVRDDAPDFVSGEQMRELPAMDNAWLLLEGERIREFGTMDKLPEKPEAEHIDATGRYVFPSFCDSHTHLVYAGSRELEYRDKIMGLSYEEIARRGGGILNSAQLLNGTSEDSLFEQSALRIEEIMEQGTGAVEIKSGYGLTTDGELKMLRVIRRLREYFPLEIRPTFLGAHAFPSEYKDQQDDYVKKITDEMLPAVAEEELADYVDVFCDKGFFSVARTEKILEAASKYGLVPKIHANELDFSGGIQTGVQYGARSVDHLEYTGIEEIKALKDSGTMPTLLPGASLFLGMDYAPARKMIDAGLPVAVASDFNPGSSPTGNMKLMMSLACIQLRMLPEEALNAMTLNTAYAMGLEKILGSITRGKLGSVIITKPMPSFEYFPYMYGSDLIEKVIIKGQPIATNNHK